MLERFAVVPSLSLQQSLYEIAAALIDARPEIVEVRMSMPNRHHFLVDLEPFGLDNPNTIFRVDDRPYGLIEACILQSDAPAAGPAWDPHPMLWVDRDRRRGTLGPCSRWPCNTGSILDLTACSSRCF